jgi:ATP-binding cassette, subfamily B, bacterial
VKEGKGSSRAAFARLSRAMQFVWRSAPGWTAVNLGLVLLQGLLPLVSLYLLKLIVDSAAAGAAAPDKHAAFGRFALYVALSGGVAIVAAAANSLGRLAGGAQAQAVTDYMADLLHAKSTEVDLEYYENAQYYDTLHRAQQEAPYRPTRMVNGVMQIGQNLISLLGLAGLLLALHWGIVAALVLSCLPGVYIRWKFSRQMHAWQKERTASERQAWYFDWLLTRDLHAKEIRLLDLGPLFRGRFAELRRQLREEKLAMSTRRSLAELAAEAFAVGSVFGVLAFIGYRTLLGLLTLGSLVMYFQAIQRAQGFLSQMLGSLSELYECHLFLSSLYDFLDLEPRVVAPAEPRPMPQPLRTGLVFDRVSFHYPKGTRPVLEEVSFAIRPGEHVAFVGENGAGKTTLIKLLSRLYDPTGGAIRVDGVDLRDLDPQALRREISVVFQDYARYQLTMQENIWLGKIDTPPDLDRIRVAACQAGADEVVGRLKDGYETVLGKWFENGEELSVGEWQKVALARAFLRESQILVLDEPTSAMDARAEYELFRRFHQLAAGRTAILISHRLSTVRMADRIYVLEDGRIIESGTHDELVHQGGKYSRLFETQAQSYR